jgi:hypothetical protein
MQFISAQNGKLQTLSETAAEALTTSSSRSFTTGLQALDAIAPKQSFARGAVHELLFHPRHGQPRFVAALLAQAASTSNKDEGGRMKDELGFPSSFILPPSSFPLLPIIWSDPHHELYPPALAAIGFDLTRLYLLRPQGGADESWAITECLRCPGVGAVVASPQKISRIEARRFQLAAERGGGVGILLRPTGRGDFIYAAATRWLVSPHPGERTIQRWTIQLLHGHGGCIGSTVILEASRENHSLRALEKLPRRPIASPPAKKRATA